MGSTHYTGTNRHSRMKVTLVALLMAALMNQEAYAVITASESDFIVDCGTMAGPIRLIYINKDPINNRIVKIFSPGNLATCSASSCTNSVYVIPDVRSACTVDQPDSTQAVYQLEIILQEFPGILLSSDPRFRFTCSYTCTSNLTISS